MSLTSEENLIPPSTSIGTKQQDEPKEQSIGAGTIITSTDHENTHSLNESLVPTEVDTSKEAKDVVVSPPLPPPPPPPPSPTPTLDKVQPNKFDSTSKKDPLPDKSSSGRLYASNSLPFLDAINLKKILSTRPSTPYTQAMPFTAVRFDLESVAEHANAAKKDNHGRRSTRDTLGNDKIKNYLTWSSQSVPSLPILRGYHDKEKSKSLISTSNGSILQYSRSTLLAIGKQLNYLNNNRQIRRSASQQFRTMVNCNEVEIEALLKRFYIWRNPAAAKKPINTKSFNDMAANTSNHKIIDGSIIRSEPPQSAEFKNSKVIKNPRCFGSGRLRNSVYAPFQSSSSRKGLKKYDEQVENRENIFGSRSSATRNRTISNDINYVKPVMSGFLVVSRSKGQESEEKSERQYTNQNDEPEWFSCGPTSRLDTIELTGFEEDEERNLRNGNGDMNKENGGDTDKARYEAKPLATHHGLDKFQNQNYANIMNNYDVAEGHSERAKKKPFHYDQYSRQRGRGYLQSNEMKYGHQYQNSSKFLPLFSCFNKNTSEQLEPMYSFASIEDFFKKVAPPQNKVEPLHPINGMQSNGLKPGPSKRLDINPNEIPLVDDLETKWRRQSSSNRGKSAEVVNRRDTNNNNSNRKSDRDSENFNNFIKQLYGCGQMNQLDNFTNIKLHQQSGLNQLFAHESFLLAQQGHYQAAAAALGNLQLKSILSRPESQALLLGLIKGDISKHGMWLQLTNPHLPHRDREAITAILTFINTQQYQHFAQFSQANFGLLPNNLIINQLQNLQNLAQMQQTLAPQHQQQQQRIQGRNKYTHVNQPVVSHEELQTHANWIMQNALIKQRIREQGNAVNLQKLWQLNASTKQQSQHLQHLGRNLNSRLSTASLQNAPPSERRRAIVSNQSRGFDTGKPSQGGKEIKDNTNECPNNSRLQSKRFSSSGNVPPKTRSTDNEFGRAKHQGDNKKPFRH